MPTVRQMTVSTCPKCLGKFGGIYNHAHTGGPFTDFRFLNCPGCHGRGAITCETCEGTGRLSEGKPAHQVNLQILSKGVLPQKPPKR